MSKYWHILWGIMVICCLSCQKDSPVPGNEKPVYSPEALEDYMYFQPGTYWIYREDSSGIEDSVYVTAAADGIDTIYDGDEIIAMWEWFKTVTVSSYDGYEYNYSFSSSYNYGCNPNLNEPCYRVKRIKVKVGDYVGETWFLLYKFIVGRWLYSYDNGKVTVKAVYDSAQIDSNYYNNVVVMNDTKNITENKQETNFFMVKNFGIIKKELIDSNKTWKLVRYNIVQ